MILILHGAKVYAAPALANLTILCFENLYTLKVHLTQNELAAPIFKKIGILSIKNLKTDLAKTICTFGCIFCATSYYITFFKRT